MTAPDQRDNAQAKKRAAAVSILSNSLLIGLKLVAGLVTGSIAIITEAVHSSIDLIASMIAYVSVSKAEEPADDDHLYGHAKIENLAAAIEGVLILLGAGIIVYTGIGRLANPSELESLGFGIAVVGFSAIVNWGVSSYLSKQAELTDSPALEGDAAHLRTDALTSVAVVIGLTLVQITGVEWLDPAVALVVAMAIVVAGLRIVSRSSRVLIDEALPADELSLIRAVLEQDTDPEVAGFHKLRARRGGSRRYIDMHVQFVTGTTLQRAHFLSHRLQEEIKARVPEADILIHIEPEHPNEPGSS